jgi:hypothetical protein
MPVQVIVRTGPQVGNRLGPEWVIDLDQRDRARDVEPGAPQCGEDADHHRVIVNHHPVGQGVIDQHPGGIGRGEDHANNSLGGQYCQVGSLPG